MLRKTQLKQAERIMVRDKAPTGEDAVMQLIQRARAKMGMSMNHINFAFTGCSGNPPSLSHRVIIILLTQQDPENRL
jgi:hypothetical protein